MPKPAPPSRLTVAELAEYLREHIPPGISTTAIRNQIDRAGLQIDADHKVDLTAFLEAYSGAQARDNKNKATDTQDPTRLKKVLECAILKHKLDTMKGLVIPIEDHQRIIRELCAVIKDMFAMFIAAVKVKIGLEAAVHDATRLRDQAFAYMREKFGGQK